MSSIIIKIDRVCQDKIDKSENMSQNTTTSSSITAQVNYAYVCYRMTRLVPLLGVRTQQHAVFEEQF